MSATADSWADIVEQHACSGLTLRQFADRHGVNRSTLAWWRWRLGEAKRRERPSASFVELVRPESPRLAPVRLRLDGRPWVVEVSEDTDLELLTRVLDRLA